MRDVFCFELCMMILFFVSLGACLRLASAESSERFETFATVSGMAKAVHVAVSK